MATAEDRACLQFALNVVFGFGPEDDLFVLRDGQRYATGHDVITVDPSGDPTDAVIATLTAMMKLHLGGVPFGQLRDDLLRSGVGEQFANRVHDHLVDVSAEEWKRLRERAVWYRNDNAQPIAVPTDESGDT